LIRVGVTHALGEAQEQLTYGLGDLVGSSWTEMRPLEAAEVLSPSQLAGLDVVVMLRSGVDARSLEEADSLVLLARWGVGVDTIDVEACTRHGVAVSIAPEGTRRAVASSAVAMILASAHRIRRKDGLLRSGDWAEAPAHTGHGLAGRTLGSIGLGRIAREMFRLIAPFGMQHIAYDPYAQADPDDAVDLVDLETLAGRSDVVCVNAALTPETHHLLDARFFARLKDGALLVNVARGPIIDESALIDALDAGRVAGAALDVFEQEPLSASSPLTRFDDVILTPHSIAWTDELYRGNGADVTRAVLAVAQGNVPEHLADPRVVDQPAFQARLYALEQRQSGSVQG
jgi:phosphoglycerate dehydrogenase-like enzyme